MYHSIYFADDPKSSFAKNTWDDWHLIPASRPVFKPPQTRTSFLDIPGADGSLDLTEALTGKPRYTDRSGSFTFYVDNGYGDWSERYSDIMAYLHGKELCAWLEDDPRFYYTGRFAVNDWASNASYSSIAINYVVRPYKLFRLGISDNWLWDPFDFENGYISDYKNMVVKAGSSITVDVMWSADGGIPEFIVNGNSKNLKLIINNESYALKKGSNTFDDVRVNEGSNRMIFRNYDTENTVKVTIKVTGGIL